MVKRITFFVFVIAFNFQNIYGQFVVGASQIDNAAQFEVVAANKGVLLPRVQLTGTNDVTTVSNVSIGSKESLLVYNTATINDVVPGYYYWDKNRWVPLSGTDNQNLTLSGSNLSIEGGNSVSLSSLDTDDQTLSLSGNNLSISQGNSVSLSGINTDDQNLTLSGSNLSIEGGNSVSLSSLDTDDQTLSLSGNNLSISQGNSVSLSGINTDDQNLTLSGSNLSIEGGNSVSLSSLDTDNQTLSLSGTNLAIQDGNTVSLSGLLDDLGNHTATKTLDMSGQSISDGNVITAGGTNEGKSSIRQGGANNTGYLEVRKADNTRLGYIGYNNTNLQYNSENGADHYFSGGNIQIRNTKGSDIINVLSGGDGIGWGNRGNDYGINFQTGSSVQSGNLARISAGDVSSGSNSGNRYLGFQVGRKTENSDTKLLYLLGQTNGTQRVGILNESPTATLDVNGNARIRTVATGADSDQVLTVDANGNIRKVTAEKIGSKGDTDDQTLSFAGTTLSISEGNNVNLSGLKDDLGNHNATTRLWMNGQEIQGAGSNTLINGVEVGQVGHGGSWLGLANKNQATTTGYALIQNNSGQTLLNTQSGEKIGFRVANAEKMTMTSAGNFGIGVTSPSAKLDVNGNARIRSIAGGTTSDQVLTVDGNGNVRKVAMSSVGGQGNTDDQNLTFSGNNLSIEGGNSVNLSSLKDNLGNHTATTTLEMSKKKIANVGHIEFASGSGAREGYIGNDNNNMQYVAEQGAHLFQGGNVGVGVAPSFKLHVNGRTKLDGSDAGTWIEAGATDWFLGRSGSDLRFYNNGDRLTMKPNGNVGIGVASPSSKLDVNGNARIRSIAGGAASDQVLTVDGSGNVRKVAMSTVGGQGNTDDQNLTFSGNNLSIEGGNSVNLGSLKDNLGNHNASTRLWMNGNEIQGAGSNTLINGVEVGQVGHGGTWLGLANKNQATTTGYALIHSNSGQTLLNTQNGQKIGFRVANAEKMTMTSAGNFGIGVTSPSAKLDVNGNARIRSISGGTTSDQVLTVDGSGNVRKIAMSTVGGQGGSDNQTLSFSGTTLSINRGNSVNLNSLKDNLGNHSATTTLNMNRNKVANVDHIEFKKSGGDGSREGYIGYNNTNMQYVSEQGNHLFKGGQVNIANLPNVSGSTFATVTENDGTLRKQSWESIKNWIVSQVPGGSDGDAWGVNGEDRTSNISRTGNVGIGGAPSFKLHVRGRAKLDGSDAGTWIEGGANDWFLGRNSADLRIYNNGDKVTFKPNGDVGIGTSSPESKLTVVGNGRIKSDQPNLFLDRDGKAVWRIYVNNGAGGIDANDLIIRKQGAGTPFMVFNDVAENLAIGGANAQGHKLRVWGKVRATSFRSDSKNYPDYVFDHYYDGKSSLNDAYKFPSLEQVEKFAKENHHLPGVTPYSGVKDGIDLSELSVQNLEKVEELYLHVIELNKTIKSLKEENKELNKKLDSEMSQMNERIEQLSKLIKKSSK
ncbi:hypothetical protein [Tenacibaculum xiamenense]|uniref:hypothetical protein n=1 Tax=Tenacibaculum xiamenense TaxID=1261553 RepID=UPI0038937D86